LVKLGIIQTTSYKSNQQAIEKILQILTKHGEIETDVVCLPEQWLVDNLISDPDHIFDKFKKIAKEYSMTIIPGAFYGKRLGIYVIYSPVIGPNGEIIGEQRKIHPFDYENKLVQPGNRTAVFKTSCKFGIIICYDMVFAEVARSLTLKGAEALFSPSRIVKNGIYPWHLYVTVRALENRIPILAANIENKRFGGKSTIVDLNEKDGIVIPKRAELYGQATKSVEFNLSKYKAIRRKRFADFRKFS
jgi:predicted amidohydrolase